MTASTDAPTRARLPEARSWELLFDRRTGRNSLVCTTLSSIQLRRRNSENPASDKQLATHPIRRTSNPPNKFLETEDTVNTKLLGEKGRGTVTERLSGEKLPSASVVLTLWLMLV